MTDNVTTSIAALTPEERLDYERTLLRLLVAGLTESYLESVGLQAQELAARMGKSKAWVSKLLSGTHNPTLDTLADVALSLGLRWTASLEAIDRKMTPAVNDPEPPTWVHGELSRGNVIALAGDSKLIDFGYIDSPSSVIMAGANTYVSSSGDCDNKMLLMSAEQEPVRSRSVKILVRS